MTYGRRANDECASIKKIIAAPEPKAKTENTMKGDKRRPIYVSKRRFDDNFIRIFKGRSGLGPSGVQAIRGHYNHSKRQGSKNTK